MLQEPPTSAYDLHFSFMGYRVRVFWGFWLAAALLGWGWSNSIDRYAEMMQRDSPGAPVLLLIWIGAVFLSILIHELGHAVAFNYYGTSSHIVLYHFGGLAIPGSFGSWNGARQRSLDTRDSIVVSAAGPAFQLLLAAVAILAAYLFKVPVEIPFTSITLGADKLPESIVLYAIIEAIVFPSIAWALLNLLPVIPLDGGQIMRGFLVLNNTRQPYQTAHMVSVGVGAVLGILFMMSGRTFAGLLFLMLAANNYQMMQYGGGGF